MGPATNGFRTEKLTWDVSLVHGINLIQARKQYRMLGPGGVQAFASSNPGKYYSHFSRPEKFLGKQILVPHSPKLYMGLGIVSEAPLGDSVKNGNIVITSTPDDDERNNFTRWKMKELSLKPGSMPNNAFEQIRLMESRELSVPSEKFVNAAMARGESGILSKENVIVLINGGYDARADGHHFEIRFKEGLLDRLGEFLRFYTVPKDMKTTGNICRIAVDGLPVGGAAGFRTEDLTQLFYSDGDMIAAWTRLGAVMRFIGSNSSREVYFGETISAPEAIMAHDTGEIGNE